MPEVNNEIIFQFENYLASLLDEMHMGDAAPEVQKDVTLQLGRQLGYRLLTEISLNMSAEKWASLAQFSEVQEFQDLVQRLVDENPALKEVVLKTLDDFYEEMVEAYQQF